MLAQTVDLKKKFTDGSGVVVIDASGWDNIVIHIDTPSAQINFNASNDGGAVEGSVEGSALTADNFQPVQATNLGTGSGVTSASADGLFRFGVVGRYIQLQSAGATVNKLIAYYTKTY